MLAAIMYYHEPWYDEAQSWLIARDAGIGELLRTITHYEGHPPLWVFILMPIAKSGIPFEIGIKTVNFLFAVAAMGIFVFKAPFRPIIRFTVPFTYFFFYQYGVISRSYSVMILGFILAALFYKSRNKKPYRFILALLIVCGSSAYGIVLSLGIVMIWLWDIIHEYRSNNERNRLYKDNRFYALLILLVINLLFIWSIIPRNDTYAFVLDHTDSFYNRLIYMFVMAPADAFFSQSNNYGQIDISLNAQHIVSFLLGCLVHTMMFFIGKAYKKTSLWIIPYSIFALFSGWVYFWTHHVGIIAIYSIFFLWCCADEKRERAYLPGWIQKQVRSPREKKALKLFAAALAGFTVAISLYWSISASIHDIAMNYGTGRQAAAFIKENELDQRTIMIAWRSQTDPQTGESKTDYNLFEGSVPLLAYFDENIFVNVNGGLAKCYMLHQVDAEGVFIKQLADLGFPDILYGTVDLKDIYGTRISLADYSLIAMIPGNIIWKDRFFGGVQIIYMRNDLLELYPDISVVDLQKK